MNFIEKANCKSRGGKHQLCPSYKASHWYSDILYLYFKLLMMRILLLPIWSVVLAVSQRLMFCTAFRRYIKLLSLFTSTPRKYNYDAYLWTAARKRILLIPAKTMIPLKEPGLPVTILYCAYLSLLWSTEELTKLPSKVYPNVFLLSSPFKTKGVCVCVCVFRI